MWKVCVDAAPFGWEVGNPPTPRDPRIERCGIGIARVDGFWHDEKVWVVRMYLGGFVAFVIDDGVWEYACQPGLQLGITALLFGSQGAWRNMSLSYRGERSHG